MMRPMTAALFIALTGTAMGQPAGYFAAPDVTNTPAVFCGAPGGHWDLTLDRCVGVPESTCVNSTTCPPRGMEWARYLGRNIICEATDTNCHLQP